jgi:integrase
MTDMAKLNEETVKALPVPPNGNRITYFTGSTLQGQSAPSGFGVRVTAAGVRSFILNYRHKGKEKRMTIGQWPNWSALQAVREARQLRQAIDRGEDPLAARHARPAPAGATVNEMLDRFVAGHVLAKGHRQGKDTISILDRLVRPTLGKLAIADLKRSHIMTMLDQIATERGPWISNRVLRILRTALNWHALRNDDFVSPVVKGMARSTDVARDRILTDQELRAIWHAAHGMFGTLCKFLLLTATRRNEASRLQRAEVIGDTWLIPASRYKTAIDHSIPLSAAAEALLNGLPGDLHPFCAPSGKPLNTFGQCKTALDEASGVTNWRLHDLRRTARSLLSRAGIPPHIAEQCLGHRIRGVGGVYDRYTYASEKRQAFEKLATLVAQIVGE